MGKGMKSYLVFTTGIYRLFLFVVVPVAAVAIQALLMLFTDSGGAVGAGMILSALTMMVAEGVLDYWAFGGIAVKGGSSLEYLKTSVKGREMVRSALRYDMLRTFVECAAVLGLSMIFGDVIRGGLGTLMQSIDRFRIVFFSLLVLDEFFVAVSMKLITRHFDNFQVNTCVASLGGLVFLPLIGAADQNRYLVLVLLAILSVSVSFLSLRKIMKRVEGSYYDKKL